jgi:hypothetical protein
VYVTVGVPDQVKPLLVPLKLLFVKLPATVILVVVAKVKTAPFPKVISFKDKAKPVAVG